MWEAIESNRRRSFVLVGLMGAILVALGYVVGLAVDPEVGGAVGALGALAVWLVLWAVAVLGGDDLLLLGASARAVGKEDVPRLYNVVEEMTLASGLAGSMPRIYLVDSDAPNAFAVGLKRERAAIAVTSGLVRRLSRDELQGVVAHEIGHLVNQDARFMTLAAVMLGSIAFIADAFFRLLWYGPGRRRSGKLGGQAQVALLVVAVIAAVLAPIAARLLFFACSRRREYLADASAARFTRYPDGLASALEKIALEVKPGRDVNRALAPLCIVNPLQAHAGSDLFSSHPPTEKRIKILRSMAGGAGYVDYERAYRAVHPGGGRCIGQQSLSIEKSVPARGPSLPEDRQETVARGREVAAALGRLADFLPITCPCGVVIQIPPGLSREALRCPRCGTEHPVPRAQEVAPPPTASGDGPALRYTRQGPGWESFKCSCGKVVQLGPGFVAPSVRCRGCGREILVGGQGARLAPPRAPAQ